MYSPRNTKKGRVIKQRNDVEEVPILKKFPEILNGAPSFHLPKLPLIASANNADS